MKQLILLLSLLFILTSSSNIKAQELSMYPGFFSMKYYQDDTKLTKSKFVSLLKNDKESYKLWKKAIKHETIGWVMVGAEIGFLVWQINLSSKNSKSKLPLIGGLVSAGISIGFTISSSSLKRRSILKYNKNLASSTSLHLGPTYNGLGIVMKF